MGLQMIDTSIMYFFSSISRAELEHMVGQVILFAFVPIASTKHT